MRITFVAIGSEQLPVSLLAAIAKANGHQVGLAFSAALFHDRYNLENKWLGQIFDDTHEVIQAIKDQKPDVLAFSCITSTYQWMLGVAREAKELFPNVKVVFGGVHPSAVPDMVIARKEVDYIVVGEGDIAFVEILKAIENGGATHPIANTRFKTPAGLVIAGIQSGFLQDLDSVPPFDKTLWEDHFRIADKYLTMASRGCPYRCSFCFNNFFAQLPQEKKGKYVRTRSVDHLMYELVLAKKRYNIRRIDFQDDVFTVYKPWLKEFLYRFKKEINVPFQCLSHPHYVDDDVAQWLSEAGCEWVQMGVQSMDEEFKFRHLQRYEDSRKIVQALESSHKFGLQVKVDHMFGLPGEPAEAQEKARVLYCEQKPDRIQTFWTCFLPGTEMMKQGLKDGLLTEEQAERINEGVDFYFYRNMDNVKDPKMVRFFSSYEFLFRILPMLPKSIVSKIQPRYLEWIPGWMARGIGMVFDTINGLVKGNPDFIFYVNHYIFHVTNWTIKKLGFKGMKGTKPNPVEAEPFVKKALPAEDKEAQAA